MSAHKNRFLEYTRGIRRLFFFCRLTWGFFPLKSLNSRLIIAYSICYTV
ncbi:MAG: hypothetical protein ACTSPD_14025 [Promethearchaeota archaeon]